MVSRHLKNIAASQDSARVWHNVDRGFRVGRGFLPSFSLFFHPFVTLHPFSPSYPFLIPSFFFFSNPIMPRSYDSRCRVRAGIDLYPPRMKTRGGPFFLFEWVIHRCRYRAFVSIYIELFSTLKRVDELRDGRGRGLNNAFEPVSWRGSLFCVAISG